MWEFPGGKIESSETPEDALLREIREELDCAVDVRSKITTTSYVYDFGVVTLTTFYCHLASGTPRASEHARIEWFTPQELADLDWAPADIPAVEIISSDLA